MTVPDEQGCTHMVSHAQKWICAVHIRFNCCNVPSQAHVVGFFENRDFSPSGKGGSNEPDEKVEMEKPNRTKEKKGEQNKNVEKDITRRRSSYMNQDTTNATSGERE